MRRPKPHIANHPGVRSGVFYFLLLLGLLQGVKWAAGRLGFGQNQNTPVVLDSIAQKRLDSIRLTTRASSGWTLRPFNPNYLDDYKGYLLGIPHPVLDSLYAFRASGGTLYLFSDFQRLSGLPDSVTARWKPYFKFPTLKTPPSRKKFQPKPSYRDLNQATALELQTVRGMGPVLSERLLRFRERLGGFVDSTQVLDVYGLDPEVAQRVMIAFPLQSRPRITKLDLNKASAGELASLVYLTPAMAAEIVAWRDSLGPLRNTRDLRAVLDLPEDRIERIALYLQF